MGLVDHDEIRGAYVNQEMVCKGCLTSEEWDSLKEDKVIMDDDLERTADLYFCDRCKERL